MEELFGLLILLVNYLIHTAMLMFVMEYMLMDCMDMHQLFLNLIMLGAMVQEIIQFFHNNVLQIQDYVKHILIILWLIRLRIFY